MLNRLIRASLVTFLFFAGSPVFAYYQGEMPSRIAPPGEKVIIVDPTVHAWGAYAPNGELVNSGMATAGSKWCRDLHRPCKTKAGSFRIYSLGSFGCKSSKFPLPRGGAPMPYCMFFHGGQALHGSYNVVPANVSHGCVRLTVEDAEWVRFNFAEHPNASNNYRGTRVIIRGY
ncbi:MAG TPA: L,D-transpeptidase [Gammaproteobacteria bacterium]|jgi:hypothetical protein|nr:L,D-transpeptidase [Gammaproteobacteria bacterium]